MFAEDLTPFFNTAEFAEIAQFGDLTAPVLFDEPDHDVLSGRGTSTAYSIEFATDAFRELTHGSQVTMLTGRHAGENFTVIVVNKQSDGATSIAPLQRVKS